MSDRPVFRRDLVAVREEQQGVAYYRIEDPATQTSFRLYEIEYLIAQKFDGTRQLPEVITAVKAEFNFDISLADLQRFVSQLESMHFITPGAADAASAPAAASAPEQAAAVAVGGANPAESQRLLTNALVHIKQGYITQARDYLSAARDLDPGNPALLGLINHLDIVGDDPTAVEISYLWEQVQQVLPQLAAEIGPPNGSDDAGGRHDSEEPPEVAELREQTKAPFWILAAVFVLALLAFGVWYLAPGLFSSPPVGTMASPVAWSDPLYYQSAPGRVEPVTRQRLSFPASGEVVQVLVKPDDTVVKGDVLAWQSLGKKPLDKKLAAAVGALAATRAEIASARALDSSSGRALKELADKKQQLLEQLKQRTAAGSAKAELKALQQEVAAVGQESKKAAQQQAKARKTLAAAKKKEPKALKAFGKLTGKGPAKKAVLLAPDDGLIAAVEIQAGQKVSGGAKAIELIDPGLLLVRFELPNVRAAAFSPAMGVTLVTSEDGRKGTISGTVERVADISAGQKAISIKVTDPTAQLYKLKQGSVFLGLPDPGQAYAIPTKALIDRDDEAGSAALWVVDDAGLIDKKRVRLLTDQAGDMIVSGLVGREQVLVALGDGQALTELEVGQRVQPAQ